jgi:Ca-activated chloride channel family protein
MRLTCTVVFALLAGLAAAPQAAAQPRSGPPVARTAPHASLEPAQASVPATGELAVRWTGPAAEDDYVVFARPGADETRHFGYTRDGNPLKIRVPGEPGEYELRYVSAENGAVLARTKITATPVTATLDAPAQGVAGSEIAVAFKGPNAPEDWVGLAKTGAEVNAYEAGAWTYANNGTPARLRLPADPGAYEIRYVSGLDPRILIARKIDVTPASATVTAPERGMAGATIQVGFTGQGGGDTFIGVVKKGAEAATWINGAYERPEGSQVALRLPGEPGEYEVRFVLEANGVYKVLASASIIVEPAAASVSAPERAKRGDEVIVAFTGPKGEGDFIALAKTDAAADSYTDFRTASPDRDSVTLQAPDEAGAYEVRYVMTAPGEAGSLVIARKALAVE